MSAGIISSIEPEIIDLEDEIADFTGDLLALEVYESSLKRLFENDAGTWLKLTDLLEQNQQAVKTIVALESDCQGALQATWIDHPNLESGYCLVLFYVDALEWNNLAVYNKARLSS